MPKYTVAGLMSGSSLDGLDVAICEFTVADDGPFTITEWRILAAETDPYPAPWRARLEMAPHLPGVELWRLHADLGRWMGQRARRILNKHPEVLPSLVGSHGHTVFHDPDRRFTTQLGDGSALAAELGLAVVTELRGADIAAGGQGAPLAPVADLHLFPQYSAFLNLGGIANVSVKSAAGFAAGDVSGCCQILDRLAQLAGQPYDAGGRMAAGGRFIPALAEQLGALPYHAQTYPKSLANDWVRDRLWPILKNDSVSVADRAHTFTKWLAVRIALDLEALGAGAQDAENGRRGKVLTTGGGAHHLFLLRQLRQASGALDFVVPTVEVLEFKEAALVALCALLRQLGEPNSLPSATGAPFATVNGAVYLPGFSDR